MKGYIQRLMLQCDKARHGELSDEEMDMLVEECNGMSGLPIFGQRISQYANVRNWSSLMGALAPVMQTDMGAPQVSVSSYNDNRSNAASSAIALASSTYSEAVDAVESLDGLEDDRREELLDLLNDARKSKGDESLAKSAIKSLVDHAIECGMDALKAVLPYIWGLLMSSGGAA